MARNFDYPITGLNYNEYFKGEYVNNNKLVQDSVILGIFYSTDVGTVKSQSITVNSMKKVVYEMTIETKDYIDDMLIDYYVLDDNRNLWRVAGLETKDIDDGSKIFKNNAVKTTIRLTR